MATRPLDTVFNTSAELRRALRDPRRFELGRRAEARYQPGPKGMITRAFQICAFSTLAVVAIALLLGVFLDGAGTTDEMVWGWYGVGLSAIFGAVFIAIKLRAMLMENGIGKRSPGKTSPYSNPEPLPKECGTEDWLSQDVRFVVRSFFGGFFVAAVAACVSTIIMAELLPPDATDSSIGHAILRATGPIAGILVWLLFGHFAQRRHPRLID